MNKTLNSIGIKPRPDFTQLRQTLFRSGKPAYVPFYELFVNNSVMERLLDKKITTRIDTVEFYYRAGYDYVPIWPGVPAKRGNLVDRREGYPIQDRVGFDAYEWPTTAQVTFTEFEDVGKVLPSGMKMIGQTGGIFEMAEQLCGYETLCLFLADDRHLVADLFDRIGRLYLHVYEGMARIKDVGAVVISDDLGFKTQTLIAPDDLREFVFPWHKKLVEIAHRYDKPCLMHSCGNLAAVMDDLIKNVGIDAKHSYEDAILPVQEAKKKYGGRIAILGGLDVDRLCRSAPDEITRFSNQLIDECGADGGYALGSGNSIADYVPAENYLAMLAAGWARR
ncbi:MAG: uroporphyrinogen decarboxylase family protein [Verrucomicrobiota bacterium]